MTIHPNHADLERAYRGPAVRPGARFHIWRLAILFCFSVWALIGVAAALWRWS